jgi:hypothetical protein
MQENVTGIAFTLSLTEADWDSAIRAWRCPALRVPGVSVDALYADGRVHPDDYSVDAQQHLILWRKRAQQPPVATASVHLTQELTTQDVTARWKAVAIWLPPAVAIIVALIPLVWARVMGAGSIQDIYDTYHLHGRVLATRLPSTTIQGITIALRPPHLQPTSDGTFDDDIPVRVSHGVPSFPDLLFSPIPSAVEPVVHLDKKWLGYGGKNYGVEIADHNINIINPIEYAAPPSRPYDNDAFPLTPTEPVVSPTGGGKRP